MNPTPYLFFGGDCAEALAVYERVLGGRVTMKTTFGEAPPSPGMPPVDPAQIMHARMEIGGGVLMASDAPSGHHRTPQGFALSLAPASVEEGERVFAALAEGGVVQMPFGQTFWAKGFGMVTDRFGTPWMVNVE